MVVVIGGTDQHVEISRCLLKSKIPNDVGVIQLFQNFTLVSQCLRDRCLAITAPVVIRPRDLDLFYSNPFTGGDVPRHVHFTVRALADEFSPNPFEDRCRVVVIENDQDCFW